MKGRHRGLGDEGRLTQKASAKPKIEFKGEVGIDSGGLTKDWFLEVSRALLAREACLFRRHDNSGLYFVDERSAAHPNCKELFRFAGQVLAKAVFERQLVAAPFCSALFKILAGREKDENRLEMNSAAAAASGGLFWKVFVRNKQTNKQTNKRGKKERKKERRKE